MRSTVYVPLQGLCDHLELLPSLLALWWSMVILRVIIRDTTKLLLKQPAVLSCSSDFSDGGTEGSADNRAVIYAESWKGLSLCPVLLFYFFLKKNNHLKCIFI